MSLLGARHIKTVGGFDISTGRTRDEGRFQRANHNQPRAILDGGLGRLGAGIEPPRKSTLALRQAHVYNERSRAVCSDPKAARLYYIWRSREAVR